MSSCQRENSKSKKDRKIIQGGGALSAGHLGFKRRAEWHGDRAETIRIKKLIAPV